MPNNSLPHHLASPNACLPVPPVFMEASTDLGSKVPEVSTADRHRLRMDAYSHETALHDPG